VPAPRIIRAKAESAPPDFKIAERLLAQAASHLQSAAISGVDPEGRFTLLYDAARKAADAVLRAEGRRITHGPGHHIAYLAEAKRVLGPAHESLLNRVEAARVTRNRAEYQARAVTEAELADLQGAAHALVITARAHGSSLRID
jgi:hypothetical protein